MTLTEYYASEQDAPRSSRESRWERHELALIHRADALRAPSAPQAESLPAWKRRANEQVRTLGYVAVWVTTETEAAL
jgi:hypothetical protein